MNLGQLQTQIQDRGYSIDTATAQADIIASVYRRICAERRWWWLEKRDQTTIQTIIGTPNYNTTGITDLREINEVRIQGNPATVQNSFDLRYMPPTEMHANVHMWRDNGIPEYWSQAGNQLWLWPYPDLVYQTVIDYIYQPPDLVNSTDIPVMPVQFHDVLIWGAIRELTFRERDVFNHRTADGIFQDALMQMRKEQGVRQRQSSRYVGRSGLYDSWHRGQGWSW